MELRCFSSMINVTLFSENDLSHFTLKVEQKICLLNLAKLYVIPKPNGRNSCYLGLRGCISIEKTLDMTIWLNIDKLRLFSFLK